MGTLKQLGNDPIFRGPRPGMNMLAWGDLQIAGVKTIINLERGYFEFFHGQMNEEIVQASIHGMTPIHLQLGDILPPSRAELFTALNLMSEAVKRGGVYVHCLHGVDRTGLVCAMWRYYRQKFTAAQAIDDLYKNGFHRFPYEALGWVKRLESCLR